MSRKFSSELNNIISLSEEETRRLHNKHISPEQLFLGLIKSECSKTMDLLHELGIDFVGLTKKIGDSLKGKFEYTYKRYEFTAQGRKILRISNSEARYFRSKEIKAYHLLAAILRVILQGAVSCPYQGWKTSCFPQIRWN